MSLLDVRDLVVSYAEPGSRRRQGRRRTVHGVSFTVEPGEVVAVVGDSGSGKTTTAHAILGLHPADSGQILLNGTDIAGWSPRRMESVRGAQIGLVPQDPGNSLNPVKTVGAQIGETLRIHRRGDRGMIRSRVAELLVRVGLTEAHAARYPHELSGGMRQRVLIAAAIALRPQLVIADEPTSALDATVQRRILDLIDDLRAEFGTAVLLVTHDLAVAAGRSDKVVVMREGRVEEQGPASTLAYTRRVLTKEERPFRAADPTAPVAVEARDLVKEYGGFRAVDGVSFEVRQGTTHALVGESGSGKTTTARMIARFVTPSSGEATLAGAPAHGRDFRKHVQLVYQNPYASLDPRQTVRRIIEEPLRNFALDGSAADLLDRVGLPADLLSRRPRELSGGQRQRVAIARALAVSPRLLVLDEAVSALDVSAQGQILDLLESLQRDLGITYLFISHDLKVVRQISHTVSVMNKGKIVETGTTEEVFTRPLHDYTRELLAAIPEPVR
ncbi:dipeptide ABC transporter ATP-binding protein [Nonomuraea mangrovi]|uniref:Dipeptide ABC transporter ATP-binding protein n=1 Tax=Nonomuraea mangrovi TaxID=2316207 RepID=A0ABW4TFZ4_9ACTN